MTPWGLVVGIDLHPDTPQLNPLKGAVADAADFAEWLLADDGGGVAPERLFFWSYPRPAVPADSRLGQYLLKPTPWPRHRRPRATYAPPATRGPTVGELKGAVDFLQGKGNAERNEGRATRCYVLLAGHGVEIRNETCFLMSDFHEYPGMVSCEQLHRALQSSGFSQVLMFLDCCRTQSSGLSKLPDVFEETDGRTVLGLGRAAESGYQSFEFGDPPSRGAFTHVLTQGLREHRPGGRLSFRDLGDYVKDRVPSLVTPRRQRPQFLSEPDDPDPPLVILEGAETLVYRDIVITFGRTPFGQAVVLTDHEAQPFGGPLVAGPDPVRVPAPIGRLYAVAGRPFLHAGPGDSHVTA